MFMLKFIQECRDANEIIAFLKLLGKTLTKEDVYNLKQNYNSSKSEFNNKLTLDQLDKVAGGFVVKRIQYHLANKEMVTYDILRKGNLQQFQESLPLLSKVDQEYANKSTHIPCIQEIVSMGGQGNIIHESHLTFLSLNSMEALSFMPEHIIQGLICCKSSSENPLSAYDLAQQDQIRKTFTYQNQSLKNKFISLFTEPSAKQSQIPPIQHIKSR